MLKITVHSDEVHERFIRDKESGTQRAVYHQMAGFHQGHFQVPFRLSLDANQEPYGPGDYELAPESFRTNQYQDLELNRYNLTLVPIEPAKAVKSA